MRNNILFWDRSNIWKYRS